MAVSCALRPMTAAVLFLRRWRSLPVVQPNLERASCHQTVADLAEYVRRAISDDVLQFDLLQQSRARRPELGVRLKMKHKRVGVQKHRCAAGQAGERHSSSSAFGSSSGDIAKYSASSAVPLKAI